MKTQITLEGKEIRQIIAHALEIPEEKVVYDEQNIFSIFWWCAVWSVNNVNSCILQHFSLKETLTQNRLARIFMI